MKQTDDGTAVVVLVVEDETLVRLFANDILTEAGYRVLDARDGQEALTILEVNDSIRAILTDVTMPNVDGVALAKIVLDRWPDIGIVVTSGLSSPAGLPKGARFICKPYTPENVVCQIEAVIAETAIALSAAPFALTGMPTLHVGPMQDAGGLGQPLAEPEK